MSFKRIIPLLLLPFCTFGQSNNPAGKLFFSPTPVAKNTLVKTYSNESKGLEQLNY